MILCYSCSGFCVVLGLCMFHVLCIPCIKVLYAIHSQCAMAPHMLLYVSSIHYVPHAICVLYFVFHVPHFISMCCVLCVLCSLCYMFSVPCVYVLCAWCYLLHIPCSMCLMFHVLHSICSVSCSMCYACSMFQSHHGPCVLCVPCSLCFMFHVLCVLVYSMDIGAVTVSFCGRPWFPDFSIFLRM